MKKIVIAQRRPSTEGFLSLFLTNTNVREVLGETLVYVNTPSLLVGDYAKLTPLHRQVLLKFVEDYKGDVILYSSEDCFTDIMLSRISEMEKEVAYEALLDSLEFKSEHYPNVYCLSSKPFFLKRRLVDQWISARE